MLVVFSKTELLVFVVTFLARLCVSQFVPPVILYVVFDSLIYCGFVITFLEVFLCEFCVEVFCVVWFCLFGVLAGGVVPSEAVFLVLHAFLHCLVNFPLVFGHVQALVGGSGD